jgi:integrase
MACGDPQDWLTLLDTAFPGSKGTLEKAMCHIVRRLQERQQHAQGRAASTAVDGVDLQGWFLELCTYREPTSGRVVDYSHRQRQTLAEAFNQIVKEAVEAGLLPAGTRVYNYPRQRRPLVHDPEVLLRYPLSGFLRLCRFFVERVLSQGRSRCHDDPAWDAHFGAAFALIALGGVCWEGAFASVARLRACHLAYLGQKVLIVPQARGHRGARVTIEAYGDRDAAQRAFEQRGGAGKQALLIEEDDRFVLVETKGWVRVHVTPFVALCVASVACYRARPDVQSTRRSLVRLHPGTDLLPDRRGERGLRTGHLPVNRTRRWFNQWLARLCEAACVPLLTVRTLARLARTHLWLDGVYPEPVLAALLGYTPYHPVPLDELGTFDGYEGALDAPEWPGETKDTPQLPRVARRKAVLGSEPILYPEAIHPYEVGIAALQEAVQPFVRGRGTREEAGAALHAFAAAQLPAGVVAGREDSDTMEDEMRHVYHERIEPLLAIDRRDGAQLAHIRAFNLAAAGLYLAHLAGSDNLSPLTIAARRSDLTFTLRQFPSAALVELGGEALEVLLALDQAAPTKQRVRGTLRQVRGFLVGVLGISLPPLDVERWPRANTTECVHLPSPKQVEELLAFFVQGGSVMDRNSYLGVCLAFEAGLRASEVAGLRIQDVVLVGDCFVEVRDTKFGKSRRVSLADMPAATLRSLDRIRRQRWRESGGDPLAPLCVRPDGGPLSADTLSRYVVSGIRMLGLRGDPTAGAPVTFHRLRHGAVCRRLICGDSPPLVARWVGHTTPGVTVQVYAHHWDWAQRECLRRYDDLRLPSNPHLTPATVGVMMNLTPQAVKAALERAPGIERTRASRVEGTTWGLRRSGGSETKVIPLDDALGLVTRELRESQEVER